MFCGCVCCYLVIRLWLFSCWLILLLYLGLCFLMVVNLLCLLLRVISGLCLYCDVDSSCWVMFL